MWTLEGDPIPVPKNKIISRDSQVVLHRKLNGGYTRDFIGEEKIIVSADYNNVSTDDMTVMLDHYIDQRDNGTPKTLAISDLGISISVLIELGSENYTIEQCYKYRRVSFVFREV